MSRYLLGYDVGSSSVKAALVEAETGRLLATASSPDVELPIEAPKPGWAEQDPESWWREAINATNRLRARFPFDGKDVAAIGIAYQMHGLVCLDKDGNVLRPSIIWCDSRAVETGAAMARELGGDYCARHLLNEPGNFTAAKLAWMRKHEPDLHARVKTYLLPGEWLAFRMTGRAVTTASGLSEGMAWDFAGDRVAEEVLALAGVDASATGEVLPVFAPQGELNSEAASALGLEKGTPICYRAGDQPNNAFSLGVLEPGEVAATCGTSGVVYAVGDKPCGDPGMRWNVFAHVTHTAAAPRYGALVCLNGAGITYSWWRRILAAGGDAPAYDKLNALAEAAPPGAGGLTMLPFGNGAERMLGNQCPGASLHGIDFNRHGTGEVLRAAIEGVAFALADGLIAMREKGIPISNLRAGRANLFLSPIFRATLAASAGVRVGLYETDGAGGAARGAGLGAGLFPDARSAMSGLELLGEEDPAPELAGPVGEAFARWKNAKRG